MSITFDRGAVKRAFSRAAGTYDSYGILQKEVAGEVASLLKKEPGLTLDCGCGTGALAESIKDSHPSSTVYGCDFSQPMLKRAMEKLREERTHLVAADCERLPFKDSSFDTVASSLTYHWVSDLPLAFGEVFRVLKPGGVFAFSASGPKTLLELRASVTEAKRLTGKNGLPLPMPFVGKGEFLKALEENGFEKIRSHENIKRKCYRGLKELLTTLKNTGATNPMPDGAKSLSRGSLLKEAVNIYEEMFSLPDGRIHATYEVLLIAAEKPLSPEH